MSIYKGSGVALITPFNNNNEVDYTMLEKLIEYHIANKSDALIVTGTTGESSTLSDEEKLKIIEKSVEISAGRIPIIAGTGSNNTKHAIELSIKADKLGVAGLLVVTPYYNKGNENGIYEHYKEIANSVNCPIILYNVPSRTGVNLSISLLKKLAKIKNIVALKEASGDISYLIKIRAEIPELDIYSGNDDMIIPMMSIGAIGVISVVANILPEMTHNMCIEYLNGNINKAKDFQLFYAELINTLFIEVNPIPVKQSMSYLNYNVGECRLPLGKMDEDNKNKLHKILDKYGVKAWS